MKIYSLVRHIFGPIYELIDRHVRFGGVLSKGETAIQVGIDMDSITSDLFHMAKLVGKTGTVIGIDADPKNIERARQRAHKYKSRIILINKATFSKKGLMYMDIAKRASWNRLEVIAGERSEENFTGERISIEADTIDNILYSINIPPDKISHVSLTVNGAEYPTLLGMTRLLSKGSGRLSIGAVAGRSGEIGIINGVPDYQMIANVLDKCGYKTEFKRFNETIWNGFFKIYLFKEIVQGQRRTNEKLPGIVMARRSK
jgi:FkbM family methyltransferase